MFLPLAAPERAPRYYTTRARQKVFFIAAASAEVVSDFPCSLPSSSPSDGVAAKRRRRRPSNPSKPSPPFSAAADSN